MGRPFDAAIEIVPRTSGLAVYFHFLVLAITVSLLAWLAWRSPLCLALLPVVLPYALLVHRQLCFSAKGCPQRLVWRPDGVWRVEFSDGESLSMQLLPSTSVVRWTVFLHLKTVSGSEQRISVFLPSGSLPFETHRRLRARLRLSAGDPAAGSDQISGTQAPMS